MDNQRSTRQQPSNRYDQVQRTSTSSSDRSTAPYSSSRRPVAQRPTDRYGQYQRSTEDSSQSQSSGYSSQRRPTGQSSANQYGQRSSSNQSDRRTDSYSSADRYGQYQRATRDSRQSSSSVYSAQRRQPGQSSANQYGQRPSSNQSNTSNRRFQSYTPSRNPDDRYGQYQRPMQEGNQRPSAQQSVNPSDRNASAYSASRRPAEQRPVDRQGQYRQSAQESRPRPSPQSNQSSVSHPDSKNVPEKHTIEPREKYTSDKKQHRQFSVKSVVIGILALLVLSVFAVIRMNRDGGSISLPTSVPGDAEVTYNYIEDDHIVKKELIGTEFSFNDSVASGTMKYRFKNVTAYNNVYTLCGDDLKESIDSPELFKLSHSNWGWTYVDDGTKEYEGYSKRFKEDDGNIYYNYRYPEIFDAETGLLRNGCHIFVFEIELTNVDAQSDTRDSGINSINEFRISGMFNLVNRSGQKPNYADLCYFAEAPDGDSESLSYHVIINPGETKTIHLGYFMVGDESEHPYSRMGLADEGHTSTYDDSTIFLWFDMSDVISKEKE